MRAHPVGHRLVNDPQMARNAPQAHPIHIALDRLAADVGSIALRLGLRGIFALAEDAHVALAARRRPPNLELALRAVAVRADHLIHAPSLPPTFGHSRHGCPIAQRLHWG